MVCISNYLNAARVLDELVLELKGKGIKIPGHTVDELKSGRSLASICARQPEDGDSCVEAMIALENAEMNLLALADVNFGKEAAEAWQLKIKTAYLDQSLQPSKPAASRIASGVPRGEYWIRLQSDYLGSIDGARDLLNDAPLSAVRQDDDFILIYGRKEDVSEFLSRVREMQRALNT